MDKLKGMTLLEARSRQGEETFDDVRGRRRRHDEMAPGAAAAGGDAGAAEEEKTEFDIVL